jgi:hypothetical protein
MRLGVVLDDETLLGAGRRDDPLELVVMRTTFLNPPRAAAARRMAERIHERHRDAELVPYAWHYLTHEASDGVVVGSNRSLEAKPGSYGHMRGDAIAQAWEISRICAEALGAKHLVIRTPPSFSPGSLSRRRFTDFVSSLGPEHPKLVWEPEGLWSSTDAAAFADPMSIDVLAPAFGMTGQLLEFDGARWLRISGSKDARLRASHAEVLAHALADLEGLTVLFEGPRAYANLRSFARALALV